MDFPDNLSQFSHNCQQCKNLQDSMVGFFSNISFCFNKQNTKLLKIDSARNAPALFDGFPVKKDGSFESGAVHGVLDYEVKMSGEE